MVEGASAEDRTSAALASSRRSLPRRRSALLLVIAAAGIGSLFYFVGTFGSNVPTGDDWDLLRTLLDWRTDGFTASSLFAFHNEHRIVATRLIYAALLPPFHGNLKVGLLFDAALVAATVVVLLSFFIREQAHALFVGMTALAVTSLVTGWFQWQNLLWSFQLPWLLLPLTLVSAIWCLYHVRSPAGCTIAVVLCLLVALACQANGVVAWIALLPPLLFRNRALPRARRIALAAGLSGAIAIAVAIYLADVPAYVARPDALAVLREPIAFARFFLATLGSPFAAPLLVAGPERWVGLVSGALAVTAAVVFLSSAWHGGWRDRGSPTFWLGIALATFGAASVLAISLGRFQTFSPDRIESRYSTFAVYFHVGLLIAMFASATRPRPIGNFTGTLRSAYLVACLALFVGATWGDNILDRYGSNLRLALLRVKASLIVSRALPEQPDLPGEAHTVPVVRIPGLLEALEQHQLWRPTPMGVRPAAELRRADDIGNVDAADDTNGRITLRGWARLPTDLPADAILAMAPVGASGLVPVAISNRERSERPDVSAHFGHDALIASGWTLSLDRDVAALHPRLVAYSAANDRLFEIPYAWTAAAPP